MVRPSPGGGMRSAFAAALCIGLACGAAQAQDATYPFEDSAPAATAPAKRAKPAVKPAAAPAAKPAEQAAAPAPAPLPAAKPLESIKQAVVPPERKTRAKARRENAAGQRAGRCQRQRARRNRLERRAGPGHRRSSRPAGQMGATIKPRRERHPLVVPSRRHPDPHFPHQDGGLAQCPVRKGKARAVEPQDRVRAE